MVMTFTVCELENGDLEIVDLLIDSMVDPSIVFCCFLYVYQRVLVFSMPVLGGKI